MCIQQLYSTVIKVPTSTVACSVQTQTHLFPNVPRVCANKLSDDKEHQVPLTPEAQQSPCQSGGVQALITHQTCLYDVNAGPLYGKLT